MSEPTTQPTETNPPTDSLDSVEMQSALFAQLVMQQANMAFMLLGKIPDPTNGEVRRDLDAAKLFIDQLAMIEAKTKGNLNPQDAALLKQSLMGLRMAFVEAVNAPPPAPAPAAAEQKAPPTDTAGGDESAKRFSKKYS